MLELTGVSVSVVEERKIVEPFLRDAYIRNLVGFAARRASRVRRYGFAASKPFICAEISVNANWLWI